MLGVMSQLESRPPSYLSLTSQIPVTRLPVAYLSVILLELLHSSIPPKNNLTRCFHRKIFVRFLGLIVPTLPPKE